MNYKKISYQNLQKEVFLLEHNFYDEIVADFVSNNMSLFFSEQSVLWLDGVRLESKSEDRGYYLLPVRKRGVEIPADDWQKIISEIHDLLNRARKAWFKKKYKIRGKQKKCLTS